MAFGNYATGARRDIVGLFPSVLEVKFAASAAGTEHVIIAAHRDAAAAVYAMTGNGTVDLSAARADDLVREEPLKELDTDRTNLKTGLQTYFTNIAAEADAAECYAFIMNVGVGAISDIVNAEWEWVSRAADGTSNVARCELVIRPLIVNDVALNSSNALLRDDGSTAIAVSNATDQLVWYPNQGIIFGAFTAPDGGGNAMAANDILSLRLKVR
jgi:hypothetical protein